MEAYFRSCVKLHCNIIKNQPRAKRQELLNLVGRIGNDGFLLVKIPLEALGHTFRHDGIHDPGCMAVSTSEITEFWPLQPLENYNKVRTLLRSKKLLSEVVFVHVLEKNSFVCYTKIDLSD